ncbi:hypothetical protein BRADI_2g57402v3 [Brachypodium distachyon]|uniref:Uncharacterized protein n=1 Tax=Brachypodium distachyon TaxID=15368 RepID=A0A2K2DGE3_BRADI|nr:hypothetical protein BRADI_2g57402v3 [Brachypodium distachyon]
MMLDLEEQWWMLRSTQTPAHNSRRWANRRPRRPVLLRWPAPPHCCDIPLASSSCGISRRSVTIAGKPGYWAILQAVIVQMERSVAEGGMMSLKGLA